MTAQTLEAWEEIFDQIVLKRKPTSIEIEIARSFQAFLMLNRPQREWDNTPRAFKIYNADTKQLLEIVKNGERRLLRYGC
jgi:hypothetical protein